MKISELRDLSRDQLVEKIAEQRDDLTRLGMKRHARRLEGGLYGQRTLQDPQLQHGFSSCTH